MNQANSQGNEKGCDLIIELDSMISDMEEHITETKNLLSEVETDMQDLENAVLKVQNLIQEANNTLEVSSEDYGKHLPNCENNIDNDYAYMYAKKAQW